MTARTPAAGVPAGNSIDSGLTLHRAGRLREAAGVYAMLLKSNPRQPDALHLLGVVMHQLGDNKGAEPLIRAAVGLNPRSAIFRNNLGMVLKALRQTDAAAANFAEAVRLDPLYADALANLGGALSWRTQERQARRALIRACLSAPAHGDAWSTLGAVERSAARLDRALVAHRRAVTVPPARAERQVNLGSTLVELTRYDEAHRHLTMAALLDPGLAEPWSDIGYVLLVRMQLDAADRSFRRAVAIRPGFAPAWAGRAEAAFSAGRTDTAVGYSRHAVELDPGNPQLRFRSGIHRLAHGDLAGGWADHDAMWSKSSAVQRVGVPPRWSGEPIDGKTLLIMADQGVGDELLFSSCVPDVLRAGARVVLECDARLLALFRRSFPAAFVHPYDRSGTRDRPVQRYDWIPEDRRPDLSIEAGGLMRWFRSSVEALDAAGRPWLIPDPNRVAEMRAALDRLGPGPKVGVAWRSMRLSEVRNIHYPGLAAFEPILGVPGIIPVCLQYGAGWQEELRLAGRAIASVSGLDTTADLDGVTALVSCLDAVICPSSTLGWIGAGVGTPVWLLYNTPCFFEAGTDRIPGFPTKRPYGKEYAAPWAPLIRRVASDLAAWTRPQPGAGA